jgi:hypothetical protein
LQLFGFGSTSVVRFGFNGLAGSEAVDGPVGMPLCRCGRGTFSLSCQFAAVSSSRNLQRAWDAGRRRRQGWAALWRGPDLERFQPTP